MATLSSPPFQYQERGAAVLTDDSLVEKRDSDLEHYLWTPYSHTMSITAGVLQTIANNTLTLVKFDTIEWDPELTMDLTSEAWSCPVSGVWEAKAGVGWDANVNGGRALVFGSSVHGFVIGDEGAPEYAGGATYHSMNRDFLFSVGDAMAIYVLQSSGGNLNLIAGSQWFQMSFKSRPSFVG